MPQIPPAGMSQVIPYLYYADVPRMVDWLVTAFGFEKMMVHPTGNGRHHGRTYWARDPEGHDWLFTRPPL